MRSQASPAGGYAGIVAAGNGNRSQCARPRWSAQIVVHSGHPVPTIARDLGRWRVRGHAAELGSWTAEMGQGTAGDRAEGERTAGLRGGTVALDCGADVRLAGPLSPAQVGLRAFAGSHGG